MNFASSVARSEFIGERSGPPWSPKRFALPWALFLAGVLGGGNAFAVALDAIAEQSLLGEPLRVVIPLVVRPDEAMGGDCVNIVPSRVSGNGGVPELRAARIALEQTAGSRRLVITTQRPVNDPAMRVTVQAGCEIAIRREYVILFDPPVVETPKSSVAGNTTPLGTAAIEAPIATASLGAPIETASTPDALPAISGAMPLSTPPADPVARPSEYERVAPAPARKNATANKSTRTPLSGGRRQSAPDNKSRLAISRTLETGGPGGSAPTANFDSLSKSAQLAAVEEQEVVLRKRVEELSIQVQRMQQERIAELTMKVERLQQDLRAAEAAQRAAEAGASQTPWAGLWRWITESWPIVVAATLLVALGAGIFAWRARRITRYALRPGEAALMASAPDTMSPFIDEENPLFVRPYVAPPRGTRPETVATKNRGNETTSDTPEAEFDYDIAAERETAARLVGA
jgi:pilus assembly protein FimV